jgi:hypothetical protein
MSCQPSEMMDGDRGRGRSGILGQPQRCVLFWVAKTDSRNERPLESSLMMMGRAPRPTEPTTYVAGVVSFGSVRLFVRCAPPFSAKTRGGIAWDRRVRLFTQRDSVTVRFRTVRRHRPGVQWSASIPKSIQRNALRSPPPVSLFWAGVFFRWERGGKENSHKKEIEINQHPSCPSSPFASTTRPW